MYNNDKDKQSQIHQILNIVKIASLSFPAIAFFQYYTKGHNTILFLNDGILLISVLIIILFTYMLWTLVQSKISDSFTFKKWIDPVVSMSIAFLSVMLTGSYASSYKFLFMFVIISSSIECSMNASLTVSGLSAVIILATDLLCAPAATVNTYFESDIVLACVFLIISWTIGYYVSLRKKHVESLNDLANIDGLTGLYNHRYFHDTLTAKVNESKADGTSLSLFFIDIDNFKYYNDLYGHQKGDEVLAQISDLMRQNVRRDSIIARYGGEEFAILLNDVEEEAAVKIAERLRNTVQEYPFPGQENLPGGNLTISIGVSTFPSKAKTEYELIKGADDACYRAKFLSKNRVEAYYSILEELQNDVDEPDRETVASIKTLIAVINAKDKYTYGHVERVVFYSTMLAEKLGLGDKDKKDLVYAAYLHDIGKINIPEDILMKSEKLTQEEWGLLRNHPQNAVEIVKNIKSLQDTIPIILQHHERFDGTGYPNRLKGEEINFLARVLTVIDCFDAMTSVRPYQQKKSYNQAIEELYTCSGTQFDPEAVRIFITAIEDMINNNRPSYV